MKTTYSFFALAVTLLFFTSLANAQQSRTLTVFAASSLTDAFEEIGAGFEAENPDIDVVFNFGNSSTLATQLVEGAPADVFASANFRQMRVARAGGRILGLSRIFARNQLVLAVSAGSTAEIENLADLAKPGIKFLLVAEGAPVRDYTNRMFALAAKDPDFGEAFHDAAMANLVSEEANVRQVTAKLALGEADVGIVYQSDITPDIADKVLALPIPDVFNTIARYPIAITNDTTDAELSRMFVDYVLSEAGQEVLVKWGFLPGRVTRSN